MWLFNWMQDKKVRNIDVFWAHMARVIDNNNIAKTYGEATPERIQHISKDEYDGDAKDSNDKDFDEKDYKSVLGAGTYSEIGLTRTKCDKMQIFLNIRQK